MNKTTIVSEIGLNYAFGKDKSEFVNNAKRLIDISRVAGITHVKLQKRNPDLSVPEDQKSKPKTVPWRTEPITYLQYKKDIEFGFEDYVDLISYAVHKGVVLFASVWDIDSAKFMSQFSHIVKIPSAKLTDHDLLRYCKKNFTQRLLSTGMSTEEEIEQAIKILDPHVIFHTNSVYPSPVKDLNLGYIEWLREKYPDKEIGLSSHYYGLVPAMASIFLKATWVEFHITENHDYWGSDQKSSVEPNGVFKLTKGIRDLEKAYQGKEARIIYPGEEAKRKSLRGV